MAIEHTRKEIEDWGCLSCDEVKAYNRVLACLENAETELSDAKQTIEKHKLDMFEIDGDLRSISARYEKVKREACWCGKPLDKHAEEPEYANAREYRDEQIRHRYGV